MLQLAKYKNIKTGAIIDSPFIVKGTNWIEVDENEKEGIKKEQQKEKVTEEEETEEIILEEMTKAELTELAKEHGIKVSEKDTKAVMIEKIAKAFE